MTRPPAGRYRCGLPYQGSVSSWWAKVPVGPCRCSTRGFAVAAARIACLGVERGVGWASRSGFAADLDRVGLVDQIGPTLAVADEPSEQHRAAVTNFVHVGGDSRFAYTGLQVVE